MADRERIKAFVQDVLGCGCAEEVFAIIDLQRAEMAGRPYDRINVGNRLLIYVFRTDDPRWAEAALPGIVLAGRKERDAQGFNRFRLVLATDAAAAMGPAGRSFEKLGFLDDRTYLHVVRAGQVAFRATPGERK